METEPLLPKISLKFLVILLLISALVFWIVRRAILFESMWARCAVVVISAAIVCFLFYAGMFLAAGLLNQVWPESWKRVQSQRTPNVRAPAAVKE